MEDDVTVKYLQSSALYLLSYFLPVKYHTLNLSWVISLMKDYHFQLKDYHFLQMISGKGTSKKTGQCGGYLIGIKEWYTPLHSQILYCQNTLLYLHNHHVRLSVH